MCAAGINDLVSIARKQFSIAPNSVVMMACQGWGLGKAPVLPIGFYGVQDTKVDIPTCRQGPFTTEGRSPAF